MPYMRILFVLRKVTCSYNCLQRIIFTYLKPCNCEQMIIIKQKKKITWNQIMISIWQE